MSFNIGVMVGWLIGLIVIVWLGVKLIKKLFKHDRKPDKTS